MTFSLENLNKLTLGDPEAKKSFVNLFISEMTTKELPSLKSSLAEHRLKDLRRTAHSIKSNAKFFGLSDLTPRLRNLEEWNDSNSTFTELQHEVNLVQEQIKNICVEMEEWLKNQP